MKVILKYLLIIFPILLSIILIINITLYFKNLSNNNIIIDNTKDYQEKIKKDNSSNKELLIEIDKIKEEKKDKIWEYDRWTKWNQEIIEKIN